MLKTKNGTLRVYHMRNGSITCQLEVETPIQAISHIELWADEDLKNPFVHFYAFGLEVYDDTDLPNEDKGTEAGWNEWYNSKGQDIVELIEVFKEMLN